MNIQTSVAEACRTGCIRPGRKA